MPAKKGLGKGLGALFVDAGETKVAESGTVDFGHREALPGEVVATIKLIDIEPNKEQPRKRFDDEALETLSQSIKMHGVIQPILVQKTDVGTYKIIAGERRWRAAKMAKLKEIPCIVKNYDELQLASVSLIENLQRENLNPIEESEGYRSLMDSFGLSQEKVSEQVGKSRSAVANSLRLCALDDKVKTLVKEDKLSAGHARTLLGISDKTAQLEIAEKVIKEQLSVRQLETIAKSIGKKSAKKATKKDDKFIGQIALARMETERQISASLGTEVKLTSKWGKKGEIYKIEINCVDSADYERVINILTKAK